MSAHGAFRNELTDHTVQIKTGPDGWFTELICPDNCRDMEWHQDDWANNGADSIVSVNEEIVIAIVPVTPEITKVPGMAPDDMRPDEELWFRPVVPEGE